MPSIPDSGDVKNEATGSLADGLVYGVGVSVGEGAMGGIGHAIGGTLAGASVGGTKGETLSTLAIANGIRQTFIGGSGTAGRNRGVK